MHVLKVILLAEGVMGLHLLRGLLERKQVCGDVEIQAICRWSNTHAGQDFKTPADKQIAQLAQKHHILDLKIESANPS